MATSDPVLRFDGRFSPHPTTTSGDVNGVRITERELRDGDEVSFGNIRLTFQAS